MKKTVTFFVAALSILTVASCTKEELMDSSSNTGNVISTVTVGFDMTKTTISDEGKTLWAEGDSLWISNGTDSKSIKVPESAYGKSTFSFTNELPGTLYLVYPYSAAKGVSDGKVTINVASTQDGSFGNANISCGVSEAVESGSRAAVALKNITAVMKINVSDANPIEALIVSGNGAAIAGPCTVDLSSSAPVVVPTTTSDAIKVETAGAGGIQYIGVVPNTYPAGFSVNAVSSELSVESKATVSAKTLAANEIADLGTVGANLKSLDGDGSEGTPFLIHNFAEWLAFSVYVNAGNDMEGKNVKLANDITGVNASVGYIDEEGHDVYFKGNFDGNEKTVTVNLNGTQTVALFGDATVPASFKNVTVAGTVTATGNYVAGLVAMLNGGTGVTISNCKNTASVSGKSYVGGIAGYTDGIVTFDNSTNSGSVTGEGNYVAGIAACTNYGTFTSCTNNGKVTNNGASGCYTAGMVGNSILLKDSAGALVITDCSNTGDITSKCAYVGGILGCIKDQELTVTNCTNSGAIKTTGCVATGITSSGVLSYTELRCYTGGIAGFIQISKTSFHNNTNTGDVTAESTGGDLGGIAGWFQGSGLVLEYCTNSGTITGLQATAPYISGKPTYAYYCGGIVGWQAFGTVQFCTNTGTINAPAGYYVGGIAGTNRNSKVLDSTNEGSVTGGTMVAGIVSYQNWSQVNRVINKGKINGSSSVGGIVGYNHKASGIYSAGNEGAVQGKTQVGGVVGIMVNQASQSMDNCYNTAKVTYIDESKTTATPYCGGIVGRHQYGLIQNVYNVGVVSCSGEEHETAQNAIGAIAGVFGAGQTVGYCYYLNGTYKHAEHAGTYAANNIVAVDNDGAFVDGQTVTLHDHDCSTVQDALNSWIEDKKAAWMMWEVSGYTPKFTHKWGE